MTVALCFWSTLFALAIVSACFFLVRRLLIAERATTERLRAEVRSLRAELREDADVLYHPCRDVIPGQQARLVKSGLLDFRGAGVGS